MELLVNTDGASAAAVAAAEVVWHDLARELNLEDQGWHGTKHPFGRLPAAAEEVAPAPIWRFFHDSAGMRFRFVTDVESINARCKLRIDRLAMPHMPVTGMSVLDLYVWNLGEWYWLDVGWPQNMKVNDWQLVHGLGKAKREYLLYLPLYNAADSVELGLPSDTTFEAATDRYVGRKPIVFYRTSITQGGCASRPGMAYASIIGRQLDWPVINLGFSGNGKSEPEMAQLLASLDPAIYVIDTLGNLTVAQVGERVEPLIRTLRQAHPVTPIVLLEGVHYADSALVESRRTKVAARNALLRKILDRLRAEGDVHLHYVPSSQLFGGDGEDTVDGTHPTDLGQLRMATGMEPIIREALADAGQTTRPTSGQMGPTLGSEVEGASLRSKSLAERSPIGAVSRPSIVDFPDTVGLLDFSRLQENNASLTCKTRPRGPTTRGHHQTL